MTACGGTTTFPTMRSRARRACGAGGGLLLGPGMMQCQQRSPVRQYLCLPTCMWALL